MLPSYVVVLLALGYNGLYSALYNDFMIANLNTLHEQEMRLAYALVLNELIAVNRNI